MRRQAAAILLASALVAGAGITVVRAQSRTTEPFTVKIIAFNDFHGNLVSPGSFRADAQSPLVPAGGVDALAGYVKMLEAENPNHVVVAAGDLVGASPLVSALFHDEPTIETMNRLGLDISSVGNHEFDKGSAELLRKQKGGCSPTGKNTCEGATVGTPVPFEGAKFQYLSANVIDRATGNTLLPAYALMRFNGVFVAFIGLTLEATPTMVVPSGVAGLRFGGEADAINDAVHELQKQGIHAFVVLIHQGGAQTPAPIIDINACAGGLAGSPIQSIVSKLDDDIGLVISGHTHQAYVCELANSSGRKIPVTSALCYGRLITGVDLTIDPVKGGRISSAKATNYVVDRTNPKITLDPGIGAIVDAYGKLAAPLTNRAVGKITADITQKLNDAGESALGDLIADSQLDATRESAGAQIAFMNRGGIRTALPYKEPGVEPGTVTYGALFTIQPFSNDLVTMSLTGAQIKNLLEQQFKGCSIDFPQGKSANRFDNQILQVSSGFTYAWNPAGAPCQKVDPASVKLNGATIDPKKNYRVTANGFLSDGGDQMYEFTRGTDRVTGTGDLDAIVDYFAKHPVVDPPAAKRIQLVGAASSEH
jgi:5'-nucleotidase